MKSRYFAILLPLVAGVCLGQPEAEGDPEDFAGFTPPESTPLRNAAAMFKTASDILENRSIKNVSGVPAMLESCVSAGYTPAAYKLLDVYEGKYAGLAAQPGKAAKLAAKLAGRFKERKKTDGIPEDKWKLRHEAIFRYAGYCERGYGREKSGKEAFRWMSLAAAEGMSKARVELARYYMNGVGCTPKPKWALLLLREQAGKNPPPPHLFFYLGYMYMYGVGMPQRDMKAAKECFERGRAVGDAQAINNLAVMYEHGMGVPKNTAWALKLYREAAAAGNKEASVNAQRLGFITSENADRETSAGERICNASSRVVQALPLPPGIKGRLVRFFSVSNPK